MSSIAIEKVSIVVPTFNQAQYLATCLDSIFYQDYPNLEIIVVNDCSTDNTEKVIEWFMNCAENEKVSYASNLNATTNEIERTYHYRYPQQGRDLKIIHNDRNLGSTKSYNIGFRQCTGKYCTYIASDDICHPQMISTMVRILEEEAADFVYSDMFVVDDAGRILREFKLPDYSFSGCFCRWYLCGVSKLYRRELHDRFGYYNEDYLANDHECYLRFAINGVRFKHIAKVLYSVRSHAGRNINIHSASNWSQLLSESCRLVVAARKYANKAVK
jgi:glycosyltransferase involved in cell wall biosynthesis